MYAVKIKLPLFSKYTINKVNQPYLLLSTQEGLRKLRNLSLKSRVSNPI